MDLNKVFEAFVNPQTVTICLAVYILTFVVRKVIEGVWKNAKGSRLWCEVWLPIAPIANGAFIGVVARTFVWPAVVGTSLSGRIMYGAICGIFSGFLYNRIRSWLQSAPPKPTKGGTPAPTNDDGLPAPASDPPPAEVPVVVTTIATTVVPAATPKAPAAPVAPTAPETDKTPPTGRS